jgi:hypothetical protein
MPPRNAASSKPSASHCALRITDRRHRVIEAGQLDATVLVLQVTEDFRQRVDRVQGGPAIQARMQVAVGCLQGHLGIGHAAQPRGDGRRLDVPHAGVADQGHVGREVSLVGAQERVEADRPDFLLAFDEHGDAGGDAAPRTVPGAQGFQEHHRLAFVVHRAAGDEALAARAIDILRIERVAVPQREWVHRLHVVVAVEQDVRPGVAGWSAEVGDDDGMARGGSDGGLETQACELIPPPLGGLDAVCGMGRLGTDRPDAQQVEQIGARCRQVGVGEIQDGSNGQLRGGRHGILRGSRWHGSFQTL